MKKISILLLLLFSASTLWCQVITNVIFVGKKGATEKIKEAHSFILVKKYPGGLFERKDYMLKGPLKTMRTYSDSSMKVLHGMYCSYKLNGSIDLLGYYRDGKKENKWYHFNDTGKVVLVETFLADSLINSEAPAEEKKEELKEGEKEAGYKGGFAALRKFLVKNLNADVAINSVNGGQIRVAFKINTEGKLEEIHLRKSVEFILDEEGLGVMAKMPDWIPAEKDGRKVNAYRIQPLTFAKSK